MNPSTTNYVIIGAGPVGLLAALSIRDKISSQGESSSSITIYEGRTTFKQSFEESYPICVNSRGLHALEILCPDALEELQRTGTMVNSVDIYSGSHKVASSVKEQGSVIGHTRYGVTDALYRQVKKAGIEIKLGHKLVALDVSNQVLTFRTELKHAADITVDCKETIVIAADGANSTTRRLLVANAVNLTPDIASAYTPTRNTFTPWNMNFRVLVVDGVKKPEDVPLDPAIHAVYNETYCAISGPPDNHRWTVTIGATNTHDDHTGQFFLNSKDPTPENMRDLRAFIAKTIPPLADTNAYFTDDEIRSYFPRQHFTGGLVSLAPLHYPHAKTMVSDTTTSDDSDVQGVTEPWIVFLGDSAHSVIPAVGEGLNSGLDDVLVFTQSVLTPAFDKSSSTIDLSSYTTDRQPDVDALASLASESLVGVAGSPVERTTFIIVKIVTAIARKLRLLRANKGSVAENLQPYREQYSQHMKETKLVRLIAKTIVSSAFWMKTVLFE